MGALNQRFIENNNPITVVVPNNYTGAASTDKYVSMKLANHVTFIIQTGAWAGGTAAVLLAQATAVAGTGTKALAFTKMWTKSLTDDTPTEVAVVSNTFNVSAANTLYIIEVDTSALDTSNGFDCIACQVGSPGSNADYYGVVAIASHLRFAQKPTLTQLTD